MITVKATTQAPRLLTPRELVPILDHFLLSIEFGDCPSEIEFQATLWLSQQIPNRDQFRTVCGEWDVDLASFLDKFSNLVIQ